LKKTREKIVYLEDSSVVLEQARLIANYDIDSVLLSNTFTSRAKEAIQVLNEEFGIQTNLLLPVSSNQAFTDDYLKEIEKIQAKSIILKLGYWGVSNNYMDPGGVQYDWNSAVDELKEWLSVNHKNINIPIALHPVRQLGLPPMTFYDELIGALSSFDIPLSIDLGILASDIHNWGDVYKTEILNKLDGNISIDLCWASAIRNSKNATIPCACEQVDGVVWDLWYRLQDPEKRLLVMTDRLSSNEQIEKDLLLLTT
jgi:hypothetical protein